MSTRWYPIYQRGNPQLRVFLPNFWLKIVRPETKQPPNVVEFACSMEMTKDDIKNYLEKIYSVPVVEVRTRIAMGKLRRDPGKGYIIKDDDTKYAFVKLKDNATFEFPNLFQSKKDENMKGIDEAKKAFNENMTRNKDRPSIPTWFSF